MSHKESLLSRDEVINETYTVRFFVGGGAFGEVYRVEHQILGMQAMKVIRKDSEGQLDLTAIAREGKILAELSHPNIVHVFDVNSFRRKGEMHHYITMEFVSGENLSGLLRREISLPFDQVISIQVDLLHALKAAHCQTPPIVHRDIHTDNILLSYADNRRRALLSDFGLACSVSEGTNMADSKGRYKTLAPECHWGSYLPASDVFSAGIVLYRMLAGADPWEYDFSDIADDPEKIKTRVIQARKRPLRSPTAFREDCDSRIDEIVFKALSFDLSSRYRDASDFLAALTHFGANKTTPDEDAPPLPLQTSTPPSSAISSAPIVVRRAGSGFDQIAGMHELKDALFQDVILPLRDRSLYEEYKVSIPNGMLLFGPPGCGKTYIARKFAEEVEYNFVELKPSDLASIYVHGTQEKIGSVFREAREKAPSIIFIDEVDAILPSREGDLQHSYGSEVNEFLAQMTECHEHGIFIIAATNRPEKIDPAILRTGRIDKVFYIAPPDFEARKEMLQLYLSDRPMGADIEIEALALRTEMYVSSDIKFIVNEGSRNALKERARISQRHLIEVLDKTPPSVSARQIRQYETFKNNRSFQ